MIHPSEEIRKAAERVKGTFVAGVKSGAVQDVAFIGNSSSVYTWIPSRIVDLDVTIFVERVDAKLGAWLLMVQQHLTARLAELGIDFELRVIRGPYKAMPRLSRPVLVAHVNLFTEDEYRKERPLLTWAWRKYACVAEQERLLRLSPERPSMRELLAGKGGVDEKLRIMESGTAPMTEFLLPDFSVYRWTVSCGEPLFAEFCLAGTATCARGHARVLGYQEPDSLDNQDFAVWYDRAIMPAQEVVQVMKLKEIVRNDGYDAVLVSAPTLAISYLHRLQSTLRRELEM